MPVFSLVLLWLRRDRLGEVPSGGGWVGLALIVAGAGLQLLGASLFYEWLEALALLPTLAGLCALLGGWRSLRWSWPAIGFLVFMLPMPYRFEVALGYPLQRLATIASGYCLMTLGLPAITEGNIIHLGDHDIGVVDACSGLGMIYTFLAVATGVAILGPRRWTDRIVILASAVPIAMAANVARIVLTGVMHWTVGSEAADLVFHDLAGWLMMPFALGLLWAEGWLISHLLVEPLPEDPAVLPLASSAPRRGGRGGSARDRRPIEPTVSPLEIQRSSRRSKGRP